MLTQNRVLDQNWSLSSCDEVETATSVTET